MSLTMIFCYKIAKLYIDNYFHAIIISMLVPIMTLSETIFMRPVQIMEEEVRMSLSQRY